MQFERGGNAAVRAERETIAMECGREGGGVGLRFNGFLAGAVALACAGAAGPAFATPAHFSSGGWGFDSAGLAGLPTVSIDESVPFLAAGTPGSAPNLDVELVGSTDICVLTPGSPVCGAANPAPTGPFSVLVSFTVNVLNDELEGPFTLMLTSLVETLGYSPAEVAIELDPSVPVGLDPSAVPAFVFDGSFDSFVRVSDPYDPPATVYDYVGWTVQQGSRVLFRYDVTQFHGSSYPQFTANAGPIAVPEPGVALLFGLGLAGLAWRGGRGRRIRA
jgi:hypothetical protein